jgi:uncharacterized protein
MGHHAPTHRSTHPRYPRRLNLEDSNIEVILQTHSSFNQGLILYEKRLDKAYSLTDCISMQTMKQMNVEEILTHDKHFTQEGFKILFQDN